VGDYDMTSFGPWYGDRNSSIEATISSLRRLREIPARTWITGHDTGVFTDNADERWRRYEDIIHQREANLLNLLARPHNLQEIVAAWLIYKKPREPLAFFEFGERALNVKHLDRLMEKGLVVELNGRYVQA